MFFLPSGLDRKDVCFSQLGRANDPPTRRASGPTLSTCPLLTAGRATRPLAGRRPFLADGEAYAGLEIFVQPAAEALESIELFGGDYWRYGVKECAHEIETITRYSHSQGLSPRKLTAQDLFHPATFETSRI